MVEFLIENGADINIKNKDGDTPLLTYIKIFPDKKNTTKLLIKKGANLNVKNKDGSTPLHIAKTPEVAKLLIEKDANLNVKNKDGDTPLSTHIKNYLYHENETFKFRARAIRSLRDFKWKTYQIEKSEFTATQYTKIVEFLIENGADVNVKNKDGNTPSHMTTTSDIVKLLIEKGADINVKNKDGDTPLSTHIKNYLYHKNRISKLRADIRKTSGRIRVTYRTRLKESEFFAPQYAKMVEFFIENGADINIKNKDGDTPLLTYIKIFPDKKNTTKLLIKKGADLNIVDQKKRTALHIASIKGFTEIVKLLIAAGANKDIKDEYDETALSYTKSNLHQKETKEYREIFDILTEPDTQQKQK
jgi:ankyrin repeat protein